MNRRWILVLALSGAFSGLADEPRNETKSAEANASTEAAAPDVEAPPETVAEEGEPAPQPAPKPGKATNLSAPPPAEDSPLVAAMKRSTRKSGKAKSPVITNETVKNSGANAHITTTDTQAALDPLPDRPPQTIDTKTSPQTKATEAEERAKKKAPKPATPEEQAKQRARRAEAAEQGYDGGRGDDADDMYSGEEQRPPGH
jgi:hypothetical protein